jgi:S1-C subfamily serine protease
MNEIMLAALLLLSCPARSALLPDEENTIQAARAASPSVVFIINNVAVRTGIFMDEFSVPQGAGSGFVWDKDGHIVTNYHVVQGGDTFLVTLKDQTELKAKLVGVEPRKDIAVLKVVGPAGKLQPLLQGDSKTLQVGQKVIAIGNPFGLDHTVTSGIVSALGRQVQGVAGVMIRDMVQTDAAINPGNSGGPLLDSAGRLIGMNTVIFSRSGSSAGIGFAVPVDFIKKIVPQLIRNGRVVQPGIGVVILTEEQKAYLLGDVQGVVIREINPGSPADTAGLRGIRRDRSGRFILGDIIVGVDERPVKDFDDLYYILDNYKIGDTPSFTVLRDGKKRSVRIQLINIF